MTREEILKAFAEMSPEDQEAVRSELRATGGSEGKGSGCGPELMQGHMAEMMQMMAGAGDPKAMCEKMMGMCKEMMLKSADKGCG